MAVRFEPFPSVAAHKTPTRGDVEALATSLRREQDATDGATARASLLHEVASLHELTGDLAAAARDELAATNADPTLAEPLESLIGIARRRRSEKNLGKLLSRLTRLARFPEEKSRAALEVALNRSESGDLTGARDSLEQGLAELPDDSTAWLALEVVAAELGDADLRERALIGRAGLANDAAWRAELLADCARQRAAAGDTPAALSLLNQALDDATSYRTLRALEGAALQGDHLPEAADAMERVARLLLQSHADEETAEATGVPRALATRHHAALELLRAAECKRRVGDLVEQARLLDGASELVPGDLLLRLARLRSVEGRPGTGDPVRFIEDELCAGATGRVAAALKMRVARAALDKGDVEGALTAVRAALHADETAPYPRALVLDQLERGGSVEAFAEALRETSAHAGRHGRWWLLHAAVLLAKAPETQSAARQALQRAEEAGLSPEVVARVARLLAAHAEDRNWYGDATSKLRAHVDGSDRTALDLELLRAQAAAKSASGLRSRLEVLAESNSHPLLVAFLRNYCLPLLDAKGTPDRSPEDLDAFVRALSEGVEESALPDELALVSVLRRLDTGDEDGALRALVLLHDRAPNDVVIASALSAALTPDRPAEAARVLSQTAEGLDDDAQACAWHLRATLLNFRARHQAQALEELENAARRLPDAAEPLLGWVRHALARDDLAILDDLAASETESREGFADLERAAYALRQGSETPLEPLGTSYEAGALWLRALLTDTTAYEERELALEALIDADCLTAEAASGIAHAAVLTARGADPEAKRRVIPTARRWSETVSTVDSALGLLVAARSEGDVVAEVEARNLLAERLDAPELRTSARLLTRLHGLDGASSIPPPDEPSTASARWSAFEASTAGEALEHRARILSALAIATADVNEDAVGDDGMRATLRAMAALNLLETGDAPDAVRELRAVTEAVPEGLVGWECLLEAARQADDAATEAHACTELARLVPTDDRAAELWERAGILHQEALNQPELAEAAFGHALSRDFGRNASFERLFRVVRERGDRAHLLELIDGRLGAVDAPELVVELLWEKARLLRNEGDRDGAVRALDDLVRLQDDHLGAWALSAELHLKSDRVDRAAPALVRIAEHEGAPEEQRWMSGLAAADLYDQRLHDPARALTLLVSIAQHGLTPFPLTERIARTAARAKRWPEAAQAFAHLIEERTDSGGRAEAARILLAIQRDQLHSEGGALDAACALLREQSDDPDALAVVIQANLSESERDEWLAPAVEACRARLAENPSDDSRRRLLAWLCEHHASADIQYVTLGAIATERPLTVKSRRSFAELAHRAPTFPTERWDEEALASATAPNFLTAYAPLVKRLSRLFADAVEPHVGTLGAAPRDRVDPFVDHPLRGEVARWAQAFGLDDFELYVGGDDPAGVRGLHLEFPTLVLGTEVTCPLSPAKRAAVVAHLFALSTGTVAVLTRSASEAAALVSAAGQLAKILIPVPENPHTAEYRRRLARVLPEDAESWLPELVGAAAAEEQGLADWCRSAQMSAARVAAVCVGEPAAVIAALAPGHDEPEARATFIRDLLAFSFSSDFFQLRGRLGLAIR